jgi:MFS family permease
LAVALAAPVVGLAADAVGRKRVIVSALLAAALPTAFAGFATTLNQLIAWRFWIEWVIDGRWLAR